MIVLPDQRPRRWKALAFPVGIILEGHLDGSATVRRMRKPRGAEVDGVYVSGAPLSQLA